MSSSSSCCRGTLCKRANQATGSRGPVGPPHPFSPYLSSTWRVAGNFATISGSNMSGVTRRSSRRPSPCFAIAGHPCRRVTRQRGLFVRENPNGVSMRKKSGGLFAHRRESPCRLSRSACQGYLLSQRPSAEADGLPITALTVWASGLVDFSPLPKPFGSDSIDCLPTAGKQPFLSRRGECLTARCVE